MDSSDSAMRHKIKYDEVADYTFGQELAGSYGDGEHKSLKVIHHINTKVTEYRVIEHRKLVLTTQSLSEAVQKYNSI
jgi:hypothetical protein